MLFLNSLTTCSIMHENGCWFIMTVSTTFKHVRSSSHEQSVPTCMNKSVNNHIQAGQLNHVQACQQPCSSWPAQPWTSLSTTMFKLASSTMFKPVNNHVQAGSSTMLKPVNRKKQAVRFYVCNTRMQRRLKKNYSKS